MLRENLHQSVSDWCRFLLTFGRRRKLHLHVWLGWKVWPARHRSDLGPLPSSGDSDAAARPKNANSTISPIM